MNDNADKRVAEHAGPVVCRCTVNRFENGRIAQYREQATAAFWDRHWHGHVSDAVYANAETGDLGPLSGAFTRHLPKSGRIVEAGCGMAQVVVALRARGYDAEGVEFAPETVAYVKKRYPELPVREGDVTGLDVPDRHYAAYISIGVIEHRWAGPEPFLSEAHRVVADDGKVFIAVPFLHKLRRLKAALGCYRGNPNGLAFYQYIYDKRELRPLLESSGFAVLEAIVYDGYKGVTDESRLLRSLLATRWPGRWLTRCLQTSEWVERHFGHMILYVCSKKQTSESG